MVNNKHIEFMTKIDIWHSKHIDFISKMCIVNSKHKFFKTKNYDKKWIYINLCLIYYIYMKICSFGSTKTHDEHIMKKVQRRSYIFWDLHGREPEPRFLEHGVFFPGNHRFPIWEILSRFNRDIRGNFFKRKFF